METNKEDLLRTNEQVVIYKDNNGQVTVDVRVSEETIWLTQAQIAQLFDKERSVVTKHITKILREKELEDSVCAKFAHTGSDGKSYQTWYYNLDMIISIGYRVNSKRAIDFRRWATGVLKEHLLKGYSLNQRKLAVVGIEELKEAISLLSGTLINHSLVSDMGFELLKLIQSYARTWNILLKYDEERLALPIPRLAKIAKTFEYESAKFAIRKLKEELSTKGEAGELFGRERDQALEGIIGSLYQTFEGKELYGTIEEKAAHLLYFIIKDHPFSDGNKRIACLLFLLFLHRNEFSLASITPESLTALALLIAESDPVQKGIVVKLVINLMSGDQA